MRQRHTFAAPLLLLLACTASCHDEQIVDGLGDDAHDVEIHHAIQHYLHKIAPKCPPPPSTEDPSCEDEATSDEDEYGTGGVEPESSHSREHWADHVARMEADKDHAERARLANEAAHKHKTCCRCHRQRHHCSEEIQIPPHFFCACPCHSHPLQRENRAATKADKELLAQLGASSDEVVMHSPSAILAQAANEEGEEYGKVMPEALDEAKAEEDDIDEAKADEDDTSALVGSPEDSEKEPGEAEVAAEPTIPEVGGHHNKLAEDPQEEEDDEVKNDEDTSAPIAESARAPEASPESAQNQDEEEEQSDGGAQPEAEEQEQQEQPEADEQEQQEERQEDEAETAVQQEEDEIEAPMLPEPEDEREEDREEERDEEQAQAREEEQAQEEGREEELEQELEEKHHHHNHHSTLGFPEHHRVWNNEPKQFDELLEEPRTGKEAFDKPEAEKTHHHHETGNHHAREASEDVEQTVEVERQRSRESLDDEPQVTAADTVEEPVAEEESPHHHKHYEEEPAVLEATSGASNEQVHFERHEGHQHQEHSGDAPLALDNSMHHQSHHAYSGDVEATASGDIFDRLPHHYKVSSEEGAPEQVSDLPHEHHSRVVSGYEASDEQSEYPSQAQHVSYDGQDMSLRQFIELAERVEHPPHHRHHYPHYYGRSAEVAEEQQAPEKLEEGLQYENGHEHHDDDAAKLVRAAEDEQDDDEETKERKLISDQLRHPDTNIPEFEEPNRDTTAEQAGKEEKETGSSNEQPKDWFGMVAAVEREKDGTLLEQPHQHRSAERTSNMEDVKQTEHVASAEYPVNDPAEKEASEDDANENVEANEIVNDQESRKEDDGAENKEAALERNDDDAAVAEAVEKLVNNPDEGERGTDEVAANVGEDDAADEEDGEEIQELHRVRKHADQAEDTPANEEQEQEEFRQLEDKETEDAQTSPIATEEYAPVADVFVPNVAGDQALVSDEKFIERGTSNNANEEVEQFEEAPVKSELSNDEAPAENMQQLPEERDQPKQEGEEAVDEDLANPSETTLDREERRIEHPEREEVHNAQSYRKDDEIIGQESVPEEAREESHADPAETNQEPASIAEQPVIEDIHESPDRDVEAELEEAPTNKEVIAEANEEIAEMEGQNDGDIRSEQQTSDKQNEAVEEVLKEGVPQNLLEPEETASETLPQAVSNDAEEQVDATGDKIAEDEPSLTGEEEAVEEEAEEAADSTDKAADESEQNVMPEENQASEAIDTVDSLDQPAAEESDQNLTPIEDQPVEAIETVDSMDQLVHADEDSVPESVAEEAKEIEELPEDDHAEEVGIQAIENADDTVLPDEAEEARESALSEAEATPGIPAEVVEQAEEADMSGAPVEPIVPEVDRAESEVDREALEETANIPEVQSTGDQPELSADEETVVENADEDPQAEVPGQSDSENPREAENPIESVVDEQEEQAEREVADNNMAPLQDEETPEEQQVEDEESPDNVMNDTVDPAEETKIADDAPVDIDDEQASADDVSDAVSDNASSQRRYNEAAVPFEERYEEPLQTEPKLDSEMPRELQDSVDPEPSTEAHHHHPLQDISYNLKSEDSHEQADLEREPEPSPQGEGAFEPELPANDEPANTDSISDLPPDLDAPVPLPGEAPPNLDEELAEEKHSGDDGTSNDLPADAKPEVDINNEPDVYNEQSPAQQPATSYNQGHTKMTVNVVHEKDIKPSQSEQKPPDNAKPNKPLFTLNIPLGSTDKTVNQKKSENSAVTADHTAAATEESHPVKPAKPIFTLNVPIRARRSASS